MKNKKKEKSVIEQDLELMGYAVDDSIDEEIDTVSSDTSNSQIISDEVALQIGRAVIEQLTASGELDSDSAAELFLGRYTDNSTVGLAALSAKAANDLVHLQEAGKLNSKIEEYIGDAEFIKLLYNMPTHAAVRIYDLQKSQVNTNQNDADAIAKAEQRIMEKLLTRKALPSSTKSSSSASPDTDYANMSSQQFRELSKRLKKAANDGIKVKI